MLRLAVCDDNINELSDMVQFINHYKASKNFNCNFTVYVSEMDLICSLEKGKRFDIYCLDIIIPGVSGIDVAKEIRRFDKTAPILFFSASSEFAPRSYSVQALNYVLKPVSQEKLFATFDQMLDKMTAENEDTIIVKSNEGLQRILLSNLVFAEIIGRYVLYHLRSGRVVECADSFTVACDNLVKYGYFVKPHRAFVVNMQYVDSIQNNQMLLQTLATVPIAQGKIKEVKQKYLDYQMEGK